MNREYIPWSLIIILITGLIFPGLLFSQTKENDKSLFDDALFFYTIEDYKEAAFLFEKLLITHPENANFNFYAGMSFLNVNGQEKKAIPYLEKAVSLTALKTKQRDFNERRAPHHARFYLGNAYRIDNQLDKALNAYFSFQNLKNFEKHYNLRILENEIKACSRAKIIQDSPLNLKIHNPGSPVNTSTNDYNPVLSADEQTIVYITSQRFYEAIMYSQKSDDNWKPPVNITSQIGSDGDMFPAFLSKDGTELYLVRKTRSGGDIYVSKLQGTLWSKAEPVNSINTRWNESHASLSHDGKFLYFTSDRRGGFGGLDIYISEKQGDGEWGPAINIGNSINSDADEDTPFLSADGNILFFSSSGHFNMGGFDIFFSRKTPDGNWGEVKNIGYPINTTNDDLFYFPSGNDLNGYIAKYDDEAGMGQEDIFRFEILPFEDNVKEADKRFQRDFIIEISDEDTGEIMEIIFESKTNKFHIKSNKPEKNYSISVTDN